MYWCRMAKEFSIATFLPRVLMYPKHEISLPVWYKTGRPQETGNECDVISGLREKHISSTFSYFLVNNALLYHFLPNWLAHNNKVTKKSVFREAQLNSWNDVTIISSLLFLVSQFRTQPEVKFHVFGTSKQGEGKLLSKRFFFCHTNQYFGEI